ncbi:MAG: tripartite tricarboxylate transporter permease, partial [Alphaproteobacteria bacterium]
LDGYPMARKGEAGRALGLAAFSSVIGGILSLIVFLLATPMLAKLASRFGPQEYFALTLFALSMLASISGRSSIRNLIAGAVGVLISTIGVHLVTGVERFTFGSVDLSEGVDFVPILIGLFAVGEMLTQANSTERAKELILSVVAKLPSRQDLRQCMPTILRSSGIGTFIGILPAEGSTVAAIMGYNEAKRWSKRPEEFGTGVPEGIAGPEAANNAATGGAMVPTLALGIPGSASTAVILAALIMHGFRPGPHLMNETPEFVYAIFTAMLIANFAFLAIGLGGAKLFATITLLPKAFLWPAVLCFAAIGSYSVASSFFDVWLMAGAGFVGFLMIRHGFGPAPLIMGLILGTMVEESFSQSMIVYDNEWWRLLERPICVILFAVTALSLGWPLIRRMIGGKGKKPA